MATSTQDDLEIKLTTRDGNNIPLAGRGGDTSRGTKPISRKKRNKWYYYPNGALDNDREVQSCYILRPTYAANSLILNFENPGKRTEYNTLVECWGLDREIIIRNKPTASTVLISLSSAATFFAALKILRPFISELDPWSSHLHRGLIQAKTLFSTRDIYDTSGDCYTEYSIVTSANIDMGPMVAYLVEHNDEWCSAEQFNYQRNLGDYDCGTTLQNKLIRPRIQEDHPCFSTKENFLKSSVSQSDEEHDAEYRKWMRNLATRDCVHQKNIELEERQVNFNKKGANKPFKNFGENNPGRQLGCITINDASQSTAGDSSTVSNGLNLSRMESQKFLSMSGLRKKKPMKKIKTNNPKQGSGAVGFTGDEFNPLVQDKLLAEFKKAPTSSNTLPCPGPNRKITKRAKRKTTNDNGQSEGPVSATSKSFADINKEIGSLWAHEIAEVSVGKIGLEPTKRAIDGVSDDFGVPKKFQPDDFSKNAFKWSETRRMSEAIDISQMSTCSQIVEDDAEGHAESTPVRNGRSGNTVFFVAEEDQYKETLSSGGPTPIIYIGSTETVETETTAEEIPEEKPEDNEEASCY